MEDKKVESEENLQKNGQEIRLEFEQIMKCCFPGEEVRFEEDKKVESEESLRKNGEELGPQFVELIKYCLSSKDARLDEMCWLEAGSYTEHDRFNPFEEAKNFSRPISVREALLIKLGLNSVPRAKTIYIGDIAHDSAYYDVKISEITEQDKSALTKEHKEKIKSYADKLEEADLDKEVEIGFRCNDYPLSRDTTIDALLEEMYGEIPHEGKWTIGEMKKLGFKPSYVKGSWTTKEKLTIKITKGHLIEAGLDPELLGLETMEKTEIGSKDIVLAEQKVGLPKRIIDTVKSFFDKMLSKEKSEVER